MISRHVVRIALIAAVAALILVPTALAGKGGGGGKPPGGGGGSTSSLSSPVPLNSTDGLLHYGQQYTFNVSTTVVRPQVESQCYRNGTRVYDEWHGFFEGAMFGQTFTLGPTPSWQSGDADCTARLVSYSSNGRLNVHATTSFHVYP